MPSRHHEITKTKAKAALLTLALTLLGGCANGFSDFYTQNVNSIEAERELILLKAGEMPVIYESDNPDRDIDILKSKNHVLLGHSLFNGKIHSKDLLIQQAIKVKATHVVYTSKYTNSQITSSPLILPNGFGGFSSTTMIGQQLRFDQLAAFMAKSKTKPRFGIGPEDLNPETRKNLGTNKGVLVMIVFDDTPAFNANLFKGDVITHVNNREILNTEHLGRVLNAIPEDTKAVDLSILRDGKVIHLVLNLE